MINWTNNKAVLIQIERKKPPTYPRSTPEVQGIKLFNLPSQTGSLVHEATGWWDKNLNPWGTFPTWGRSGTYHPIPGGRAGGKSPYLVESWRVCQCWKRLSDPRLACNTRSETFEPGRWCYQKSKSQQKNINFKKKDILVCANLHGPRAFLLLQWKWWENVLFPSVLWCALAARYAPYRLVGDYPVALAYSRCFFFSENRS